MKREKIWDEMYHYVSELMKFKNDLRIITQK